MMRTLVVNLTRFGDLLQTQVVLSALKARGGEVDLVCLENFRPAAALLDHVDRVFDVAGARLLARLDHSWPEALGEFLGWIGRVRGDAPAARVLNLTPTLTGRLLARNLTGGALLGLGLDENGFGAYSSAWAAFLEASSRHRGASPFNLVDLFWMAAHLDGGPRPFALARPGADQARAARERLAGLGGSGARGFVGLQLGASAPARQWPVESFARVAEFLTEGHGLVPVLLGGAGEEALAREFSGHCRIAAVDLVGKTDLSELAAVVAALRLLVSNDTGTMHLAAGLGVPALAVFLATAQPWDTGPYLAGCCCLEPDLECHPCAYGHQCQRGFVCRHTVSPEAAVACLEGYLASGNWPQVPGRGIRAWETVFEPDHFLGLASRSGHEGADRTVWNRIQRACLRRFLGGDALEIHFGDGLPLSSGRAEALLEPLDAASALAGTLLVQARAMRSGAGQDLGSRFMATWQRLESVLDAAPALCALGHLWSHLSQEHGRDLGSFEVFTLRFKALLDALAGSVRARN